MRVCAFVCMYEFMCAYEYIPQLHMHVYVYMCVCGVCIGIYIWANGDKYQGEWCMGQMHGKGIKTMKSGDTYDGVNIICVCSCVCLVCVRVYICVFYDFVCIFRGFCYLLSLFVLIILLCLY